MVSALVDYSREAFLSSLLPAPEKKISYVKGFTFTQKCLTIDKVYHYSKNLFTFVIAGSAFLYLKIMQIEINLIYTCVKSIKDSFVNFPGKLIFPRKNSA